MSTVTVHAAKTRLSELLRQVEQGEEVVIARGRTPVAKLVPYRASAEVRGFGSMRGRATVGPEFFEPLPEDELRGWEGG